MTITPTRTRSRFYSGANKVRYDSRRAVREAFAALAPTSDKRGHYGQDLRQEPPSDRLAARNAHSAKRVQRRDPRPALHRREPREARRRYPGARARLRRGLPRL